MIVIIRPGMSVFEYIEVYYNRQRRYSSLGINRRLTLKIN